MMNKKLIVLLFSFIFTALQCIASGSQFDDNEQLTQIEIIKLLNMNEKQKRIQAGDILKESLSLEDQAYIEKYLTRPNHPGEVREHPDSWYNDAPIKRSQSVDLSIGKKNQTLIADFFVASRAGDYLEISQDDIIDLTNQQAAYASIVMHANPIAELPRKKIDKAHK